MSDQDEDKQLSLDAIYSYIDGFINDTSSASNLLEAIVARVNRKPRLNRTGFQFLCIDRQELEDRNLEIRELQQEIIQLQENDKRNNTEIERLKEQHRIALEQLEQQYETAFSRQKELYDEQIQDAISAETSLNDTLCGNEQEIETLNHRIEGLNKQIQELQANLDQETASVKALKSDNDSLKQHNLELAKKNKELNDTFEEKVQQRTRELQTQVIQLEAVIAGQNADIDNGNTELQTLKEKLAQKGSNIEELLVKITRGNEQLVTLETERNELVEDLKRVKESLAQKELEFETLSEDIPHKDNRLSALETERNALSGELATANTNLNVKDETINNLEGQIDDLEAQIADGNSELQKLTEDLEKDRGIIAGKEIEIMGRDAQLKEKDKQIQNLKAQVDDTAQLDAARQEAEECRQRVDELQAAHDAVVAQKDTVIRDLKAQVDDETQLNAVRQEVDECRRRVDELQTAHDIAITQKDTVIRDLETELAERNARIEQTVQEQLQANLSVGEKKNRITALETQIKEKDRHILDLEENVRRLANYNKHADMLEEQLRRANAQIREQADKIKTQDQTKVAVDQEKQEIEEARRRVEERFKNLSTQKVALEKNLATERRKAAQARAELDETRQNQNRHEQGEIHRLTEANNNLNRNVDNLTQTTRRLQQQIDKCEQDKKNLQQTIDRLNLQIQSKDTQIESEEKLRTDLARQKRRSDELAKTNRQLHESNERLILKNNEFNRKKRTDADCQQQLQVCEERVLELENDHADAVRELGLERERVAALQEENAALNRDLGELQVEIGTLRGRDDENRALQEENAALAVQLAEQQQLNRQGQGGGGDPNPSDDSDSDSDNDNESDAGGDDNHDAMNEGDDNGPPEEPGDAGDLGDNLFNLVGNMDLDSYLELVLHTVPANVEGWTPAEPNTRHCVKLFLEHASTQERIDDRRLLRSLETVVNTSIPGATQPLSTILKEIFFVADIYKNAEIRGLLNRFRANYIGFMLNYAMMGDHVFPENVAPLNQGDLVNLRDISRHIYNGNVINHASIGQALARFQAHDASLQNIVNTMTADDATPQTRLDLLTAFLDSSKDLWSPTEFNRDINNKLQDLRNRMLVRDHRILNPSSFLDQLDDLINRQDPDGEDAADQAEDQPGAIPEGLDKVTDLLNLNTNGDNTPLRVLLGAPEDVTTEQLQAYIDREPQDNDNCVATITRVLNFVSRLTSANMPLNPKRATVMQFVRFIRDTLPFICNAIQLEDPDRRALLFVMQQYSGGMGETLAERLTKYRDLVNNTKMEGDHEYQAVLVQILDKLEEGDLKLLKTLDILVAPIRDQVRDGSLANPNDLDQFHNVMVSMTSVIRMILIRVFDLDAEFVNEERLGKYVKRLLWCITFAMRNAYNTEEAYLQSLGELIRNVAPDMDTGDVDAIRAFMREMDCTTFVEAKQKATTIMRTLRTLLASTTMEVHRMPVRGFIRSNTAGTMQHVEELLGSICETVRRGTNVGSIKLANAILSSADNLIRNNNMEDENRVWATHLFNITPNNENTGYDVVDANERVRPFMESLVNNNPEENISSVLLEAARLHLSFHNIPYNDNDAFVTEGLFAWYHHYVYTHQENLARQVKPRNADDRDYLGLIKISKTLDNNDRRRNMARDDVLQGLIDDDAGVNLLAGLHRAREHANAPDQLTLDVYILLERYISSIIHGGRDINIIGLFAQSLNNQSVRQYTCMQLHSDLDRVLKIVARLRDTSVLSRFPPGAVDNLSLLEQDGMTRLVESLVQSTFDIYDNNYSPLFNQNLFLNDYDQNNVDVIHETRDITLHKVLQPVTFLQAIVPTDLWTQQRLDDVRALGIYTRNILRVAPTPKQVPNYFEDDGQIELLLSSNELPHKNGGDNLFSLTSMGALDTSKLYRNIWSAYTRDANDDNDEDMSDEDKIVVRNISSTLTNMAFNTKSDVQSISKLITAVGLYSSVIPVLKFAGDNERTEILNRVYGLASAYDDHTIETGLITAIRAHGQVSMEYIANNYADIYNATLQRAAAKTHAQVLKKMNLNTTLNLSSNRGDVCFRYLSRCLVEGRPLDDLYLCACAYYLWQLPKKKKTYMDSVLLSTLGNAAQFGDMAIHMSVWILNADSSLKFYERLLEMQQVLEDQVAWPSQAWKKHALRDTEAILDDISQLRDVANMHHAEQRWDTTLYPPLALFKLLIAIKEGAAGYKPVLDEIQPFNVLQRMWDQADEVREPITLPWDILRDIYASKLLETLARRGCHAHDKKLLLFTHETKLLLDRGLSGLDGMPTAELLETIMAAALLARENLDEAVALPPRPISDEKNVFYATDLTDNDGSDDDKHMQCLLMENLAGKDCKKIYEWCSKWSEANFPDTDYLTPPVVFSLVILVFRCDTKYFEATAKSVSRRLTAFTRPERLLAATGIKLAGVEVDRERAQQMDTCIMNFQDAKNHHVAWMNRNLHILADSVVETANGHVSLYDPEGLADTITSSTIENVLMQHCIRVHGSGLRVTIADKTKPGIQVLASTAAKLRIARALGATGIEIASYGDPGPRNPYDDPVHEVALRANNTRQQVIRLLSGFLYCSADYTEPTWKVYQALLSVSDPFTTSLGELLTSIQTSHELGTRDAYKYWSKQSLRHQKIYARSMTLKTSLGFRAIKDKDAGPYNKESINSNDIASRTSYSSVRIPRKVGITSRNAFIRPFSFKT